MKRFTALVFALALSVQLVPMASAHEHPGLPAQEPDIRCSAWAADEISRARQAGLVIGSLDIYERSGEPINRADFCGMAMQYMAVSEGQVNFWSMVEQYKAPKGEYGNVIRAFSDCGNLWPIDRDATLAHVMGLVEGVGDGRFAPERQITRQEAAVMLARAYTAVGGVLPEGEADFADMDQVADWARDGVAAVEALGVMQGVGKNTFAPLETYSVEQCVVTFLRLYEKAPVSAVNGNVQRMFTYEQVMDNYAYDGWNSMPPSVVLTVEGPAATLVQTASGGGTSFFTQLWLVGRDGSQRRFDPGVCNYERYPGTLRSTTQLIDPQFSEDGRTLTFTIRLEEDVTAKLWQEEAPDSPLVVPLHEKGDYLCTVDVETGVCTAGKQ